MWFVMIVLDYKYSFAQSDGDGDKDGIVGEIVGKGGAAGQECEVERSCTISEVSSSHNLADPSW